MICKAAAICFVFISAALLYSGCSWVDDNLSDCPSGCWLRLSYTYNMLDVDAVSTQVKNATVFVLDAKGSCILREDVDSLTLLQHNYMIKLPALPASEYAVLVWAGLADAHYQYTSSVVRLSRDEMGEQSDPIASLFHGRLDNITIDGQYKVLEVPLTKNTNTLSCVLQSSNDVKIEKEAFRLELTARNGLIDHRNIPMDTACICYLPFTQNSIETEGLQIVHLGLNTLRLLENDDTQLTLIYTPSGEPVFSIPLSQYLILSGQVHVPDMKTQEYLDRQDQYNLLFFLVPTENPQSPFLCMQMEVNGWRVRLNDAELGEAVAPWSRK